MRDLQENPHEQTHCTAEPELATALKTMKQVFEYWYPYNRNLEDLPVKKNG